MNSRRAECCLSVRSAFNGGSFRVLTLQTCTGTVANRLVVRCSIACVLVGSVWLAAFAGAALAKTLPDVSTGPTTTVGQTSGTLTGTVDPAGGPNLTGCHFEYGPSAGEYTTGTLPCEPGAPYASLTQVTAMVSRLTPTTTYHYRLVASSVEGTSVGEDETFTTQDVTGLTTQPATAMTVTGANLNGSWIGNGEDTHYYFEWGKTSSYGNITTPLPGLDGGSGSGAQARSVTLEGLEVETLYHYRIVASNSVGTSFGADQTFETIGLPIYSYASGPSTSQAGGHPDIVTSASFASRLHPEERGNPCNCQDAKIIKVSLPAGVVGNPHATPHCTAVDFGEHQCPPSSQVGFTSASIGANTFYSTLYNLEPNSDQAGILGFYIPDLSVPVFILLSARTGSDYGLDATIPGLEHLIPPNELSLHLWGIPADSSHDVERAPIGKAGCANAYPCFPPNSSSSEPVPFLDNPTSCGESLSSSLELTGYNSGTTQKSSPWPATTGCDQLSFNPSLYAQPTTQQADSASGLDVDLNVPQLVSPNAPSPSEIRALRVTLPSGMSINPNAADGKTSCSNTEARFGTEEESQCPETSKVGTLSLASSALPAPIPGAIYIGRPQPGNRYRLFIVANGFATHVKLAGSVEPDSQTGQLVISFQDLPQSPFSEFNFHFFGSERGLLATPDQCGTYSVTSSFVPWDESLSEQTSSQNFTLDSGPNGTPCPPAVRPFSPSFIAGVTDATAGVHTPFALELSRPDGDQNLSALTVSVPPGLLATLKGVPYCPDAALSVAAQSNYSGLEEESSPSCPIASQIGAAQVGAGAGTHPVYLSGTVYLAGPYEGAPLSLAVITPAVSGPYDLGNVVVRAALHVNPETARITAVSDPLPQILEGIPLRLRSIRLDLNRPNFILNPTNCDPSKVTAEIFGDQGAIATPSEHFQVASCRALSFAPKLSSRISGATKRNGNPGLDATLTSGSGEANIARTAVTLPHTELLDNAHIKNPCTKVQFAAGNCPAGSIIGVARAVTPLLEKPLEGSVYLRSAPENKSGLPDVVAALNGQIDIDLDGKIETINGRLRANFAAVPDAPVSKFTLSLDGGPKGLLVNSTNLCASTQHVKVLTAGQNGKSMNQSLALQTPCGKTGGKKPKRQLQRARVVAR